MSTRRWNRKERKETDTLIIATGWAYEDAGRFNALLGTGIASRTALSGFGENREWCKGSKNDKWPKRGTE